MNSLDLMQARLRARGGVAQQDRMIKDKRETLDRVVWYSYQGADVRKLDSETVERALINPNTVKQDYDDKTISIGYEHDYKPGTIFEWVNTNTKWLIYLQDLTELAYFKGDIRKCNYKIKWKKGDQVLSTYAAVRGPVETKINSTKANKTNMDLPSHTLQLMLPATPEVLEYFTRYNKFYLNPLKEGDIPVCWSIEATDTISTQGVLEVTASEDYIDNQQDDVKEGLANIWVEDLPVEPENPSIIGNVFIKPKKSYEYEYIGKEKGIWSYDTRLPIDITTINDNKIVLTWKTTYTGEFVLQYLDTEDKNIKYGEKTIVVESLF